MQKGTGKGKRGLRKQTSCFTVYLYTVLGKAGNLSKAREKEPNGKKRKSENIFVKGEKI